MRLEGRRYAPWAERIRRRAEASRLLVLREAGAGLAGWVVAEQPGLPALLGCHDASRTPCTDINLRSAVDKLMSVHL